MYIDSQDTTGHKTYRRHIPLTVNSVHRLNIKYIKKHIKDIKYKILSQGGGGKKKK